MKNNFIELLSQAKDNYTECKPLPMKAALTKAGKLYAEVREDCDLEEIALYHKLYIRYLGWQTLSKEQRAVHTQQMLSHFKELELLEHSDVRDFELVSSFAEHVPQNFLEKAIVAYPNSSQLKRNLARYYKHHSEYEKAQMCLRQAHDDHPFDLAAIVDSHSYYFEEAQVIAGEDFSKVPEDNFERMVHVAHNGWQSELCLELLEREEIEEFLSEEEQIHLKCINLSRMGAWRDADAEWSYVYDNQINSLLGKIAYAEFLQLIRNYEESRQLLEDFPSIELNELNPADLTEALEEWGHKELTKSQYLNALLLRANALRVRQLTEGAEDQYQRALLLYPENTVAYIGLTRLLFEEGEHSQAFDMLKITYAKGLSDKEYLMELAEMYFRTNRWDPLYNILRRFHEDEMVSSRSAFLYGYALIFKGYRLDAIKWFTKVIENFGPNPNLKHALYYRALAYRKLHKFSEAIDDVNQLIPRCDPNSDDYWSSMLLMGDLAYMINAGERAYEYLVQIHKHRPLQDVYLLYLQLLIHDGYDQITGIAIPEGLELLSEESEIAEPEDDLEYLTNAKVYTILERYEEAADAYAKVAELGYKPAVYYYEAFNSAFEAKAYEKVILFYDKLKEHAPKLFNDVLGARWAFSLFKLERYKEAAQAYHDILYDYKEISEDKDSTIKWCQVIFEAYKHEGNYEEAIKYVAIKCNIKQEVTGYELKQLEDMASKREPYSEDTHLATLKVNKVGGVNLPTEKIAKLEELTRRYQQKHFYH